ncbi:MAG TPA: hypothetical protein VH325_06745 [Bryobacteraceae bacterium]|nr:hypothetical protein [Bryobacteraceae bacterium]
MTRHELKEQLEHDRFKDAVQSAVTYTVSNRQNVTILAIIAAVVLVVAGGVVWYMHARGLERQHDLQNAMELVEAQVGAPTTDIGKVFPTQPAKDAAILKAFKDVAQKDSGSREGMIANYYAGSLEAEVGGDVKDAESRLRTVVADGGEYSSLSKIALARIEYFNGNQSDAVSLLQGLIDKPTDLVSKAQAQMMLAQLISTNDPRRAKSLLASIQNPTQNPDISRAIEQLQAQLTSQ